MQMECTEMHHYTDNVKKALVSMLYSSGTRVQLYNEGVTHPCEFLSIISQLKQQFSEWYTQQVKKSLEVSEIQIDLKTTTLKYFRKCLA